MVDVSVQISGLTEQGLGQAEVNERPLLVRNALPGEQVNARILKKRKGVRFADGYPLSNLHPHRVASACSAFPRCGGCSMHHLAYGEQLSLKERQLRSALDLHQVQPLSWRQPVSALRSGYRTKARLGVRQLGDQVLVGFRESFSNRVARLPECLILTPQLSRLIQPLARTIEQLSAPDKIPQIEFAQGDDGVSVIVRHLVELSESDRARWLAFESVHQVEVVLQSAGYDSLCTLAGSDLAPSDRSYQLPAYGLTLFFAPHQFTQVNLQINRDLISAVLSYLGPLNGKRVVDLFCGIGNFSLPMSRRGARVSGFEASAGAVDKARHNARFNHTPAHFESADLYQAEQAEDVAQHVSEAHALVLDPPRSGAGPQLPAWLQVFTGQQIVYVSCNPATFAEDAVALQNAGFVLREVGVYDMFPHTAHIETLGYFEREAPSS